jgi:alkylation response protein AidB-like acyl-CoA dehydrogenase
VGLAIDRDEEELAGTLRETLERMGARGAARVALDAEQEELPAFWDTFGQAGWLGVHVPESLGGAGAGLLEACLVLEALGEVCAPGPALSCMLSAGVLAAEPDSMPAAKCLPSLLDGSSTAATGLGGSLRFDPQCPGELTGDAGPVLRAGLADHLLLRVGNDLVVVERGRPGLRIERIESMDRGMPTSWVYCDGLRHGTDEVLRGAVGRARVVGRVLAAAHAAGGAAACQRMGTAYAKVREQFGKPIGAFQAVKHMCADMLVQAESAAAVAWDAVRAQLDPDRAELAGAVAGTIALRNFMRCAEINVQIHGGIGFTWDHDAHLYLRRAASLAALFDPAEKAADDVLRLISAGVTRDSEVPLPAAAQRIQEDAHAFLASLEGRDEPDKQRAFARSGYLMPEWPTPWGRGADALQQYVVKQELRSLPRPVIDVPWVPMTIGQEGTREQTERFLSGSLDGSVQWCQLSSEPEAGSDAAAVRTRAVKVDGGWSVTGQKVWTSHAATATHGLATVRTDPERPKHAGISILIIDMSSPGITIRPLREIAGGARPSASEFGDTSFNEVFFDEVFVPDENLLGEVNDGWRIVRVLLGNERVTIGERSSPVQASTLVDLLAGSCPDDAGRRREVGLAVAEEQAVEALNLRRLLGSLYAGPPGPEANVVKILNSERIQRIAALGIRMLGEAGVDEEEDFGWLYLRSRFTTIGGGTSEITRNVLAERVLGLPRDR